MLISSISLREKLDEELALERENEDGDYFILEDDVISKNSEDFTIDFEDESAIEAQEKIISELKEKIKNTNELFNIDDDLEEDDFILDFESDNKKSKKNSIDVEVKSETEDLDEIYAEVEENERITLCFRIDNKYFNFEILDKNNIKEQQLVRYSRCFRNIQKGVREIDKLNLKSNFKYPVWINPIYFFKEDCYKDNQKYAERFMVNGELANSTPACYSPGKQEIIFYTNKEFEPNIKHNLGYVFHEYGHHLLHNIQWLLCRDESKKRKFNNLIKADYKIATRRKNFLTKTNYKRYYEHVCPPLNFILNLKEMKKSFVSYNGYSQELFAEIFCDILMHKQKVVKINKFKNKDLKLMNIFPNTRYIVNQLIKGKGINKYKRFKK